MTADAFRSQVALLVRTLPFVAREACFALKGGTAINLFFRDLPRLSVDIDLVYLPIAERDTSVAAIRQALGRIAQAIRSGLRGSVVNEKASTEGTRILVRQGAAQIQIEVTPVLRGTIHPPSLRRVTATVEEAFGFAETSVVSFADLYAGKLVAGLDRQHPRDLFDIHHLLAHEGIDDGLLRAFVVYLVSHTRPCHEVLFPRRKDILHSFEHEFSGLTVHSLPLETLLAAREEMVAAIHGRLDKRVCHFLRSFHALQPEWSILGFADVAGLPAVRWKLLNLTRLHDEQPEKYRETVRKLDEVLPM